MESEVKPMIEAKSATEPEPQPLLDPEPEPLLDLEPEPTLSCRQYYDG